VIVGSGFPRRTELMKDFLATVLNHGRSYFAAALEHSHYDGLLERVILPLRCMHVPSLAADHSFIDFNFSRELAPVLSLMGEPDAMQHEPSGLLTHSESAANLPRRDTVLGIRDEPHCRKPFIQAERAILKNRSNLDGELAFRVVRATLPAEMLFEKTYADAPAGRAFHNAVRPSLGGKKLQTVFRTCKINDCFLKSRWYKGFHVFYGS
jgi:hypothetical protein